jgi:hypothetical protein
MPMGGQLPHGPSITTPTAQPHNALAQMSTTNPGSTDYSTAVTPSTSHFITSGCDLETPMSPHIRQLFLHTTALALSLTSI